MMSGQLGQRRKVRFMPGDFKYQDTKQPPLKDAYDEFLARIICFVFSVSPEPFVSHVNRATAESSQSRAIDEGLAPLQRYVRGLMNRIIKLDFASPDLEFVWQDTREQDPKDAAQIDVAYVGAGIMTVNEVRANMGLAPVAWGNGLPPEPAQKKTLNQGLRKDDGEDEEGDDEEDGQSGDEDDEGEEDDAFNAQHPRWPAGSPGGIGGEFAPKGSTAAASTPDSGSFSTDDIRSAIEDGMDSSSRLPLGVQVAGDNVTPGDSTSDQALGEKSKDECIEECSEKTLPTNDFGASFFRCLNECLGQNA